MTKYTVVGGRGFIGNQVVSDLRSYGHEVWVPEKNDPLMLSESLGIVIYCAGHGDCVNNPFKVFESNTSHLALILQHATFERLIYISSTRVSMSCEYGDENAVLKILPNDPRRLFNLTKLVSEELCLASSKNVLIIRPSNVYGLALSSPLFLPAITKNAIVDGKVDLYVTPEYQKDYVFVEDLSEAIYKLSRLKDNPHRIFNIASGINTKACDIASLLEKKTKCELVWHDVSLDDEFPVTDISKLKGVIDYQPRNVLDDLSEMIDNFKSLLIEDVESLLIEDIELTNAS